MRLRTGTSGFAYRAWKGAFYPDDLPDALRLRWYATRLDAVELNNTFYRMPTAAALARWAAETPDGFAFGVKAPQRLTHRERLDPGSEALEPFVRALAGLGPRLGAVLFQLPPYLPADVARLRDFLARLPAGLPVAFEFRHPSWFGEPVLEALAARGAALCLAQSDALDTPRVATAPFGYLRLRRTDYGPRELSEWADFVAAQRWREAFAFFKHEEAATGPRWAAQLRGIWRERVEAPGAQP